MKVVVTGSEGFIGKALVAALEKRGVDVVGIDRKSGTEAGDYFASADLSDVDVVYHLAAQTSVFNEDDENIIKDNIRAFVKVVLACKQYGTRLIYASSSTAFNVNTTSLYGLSKRFNEEYAMCYYPEATGVRLHNVYGPNPRQGTLLWCLLNQEEVELYYDGSIKRHFTYIDDVVDGLMAVEKFNLPLVNIVNPRSVTISDFAFSVNWSNNVKIKKNYQWREFDKKEQLVDPEIFTLPLHYTRYEDGIEKVFRHLENEKAK